MYTSVLLIWPLGQHTCRAHIYAVLIATSVQGTQNGRIRSKSNHPGLSIVICDLDQVMSSGASSAPQVIRSARLGQSDGCPGLQTKMTESMKTMAFNCGSMT